MFEMTKDRWKCLEGTKNMKCSRSDFKMKQKKKMSNTKIKNLVNEFNTGLDISEERISVLRCR